MLRSYKFQRVYLTAATALALAVAVGLAQSNDSRQPPGVLEAPTVAKNVSQDLQAAKEALEHGELELARLHLFRALQQSPGDTDALEVFADVQLLRGRKFCAREEHLAAARCYQELHAAIEQAQAHLVHSDESREAFRVLVQMDKQLDQAQSELRVDVERKALDHIRAADHSAVDAHRRWYTFSQNDRNVVREGLRQLNYVNDRYDLAGNWLQGEYWRAINRLKGLVSDKEWDAMLASAGFVARSDNH